VITKPIGEMPMFSVRGCPYLLYTEELDEERIARLPARFTPSLFQESLEKECEVRTFFLAGELFSAAIFSQTDSRTRTDFRRYNFKRPNRIVPYRLPEDVARKLTRLMGLLGLLTGSLDLICTKDGRLVFLEVNPIGQFGMISDPCNYHLERVV